MTSSILTVDTTLVVCTIIFSIAIFVVTVIRLRCNHKYEIIKEVRIVTTNRNGEESVTGFQYISRCTKCGKFKEDTV